VRKTGGKMIGIYKITNRTNNKVYIGQSVDIKTRWYNHKKELNGQRHCNSYL
jgi:predicted GIY-YIG superfamily endonuclease